MRPSVFARAGYAVVIVTFAAAIASAQTAPPRPTVDPRWAPWLGCWQIIDESIHDAPTLADALVSLGRPRATTGPDFGDSVTLRSVPAQKWQAARLHTRHCVHCTDAAARITFRIVTMEVIL